MKRLVLTTILSLLMAQGCAIAQEAVATYDQNNIATLNDELSRIRRTKVTRTYVDSKFPVDLTLYGSSVTGILPISTGGTGKTTAQEAIDALLPSQASASGKYLTSDGTNSSWGTITPVGLGSWVSKTHSTNYQAATDGFFCCNAGINSGGGGYVDIWTDSSATPSTSRCHNENSGTDAGCCSPVKKNDYYRGGATGGDIHGTCYFIPLS